MRLVIMMQNIGPFKSHIDINTQTLCPMNQMQDHVQIVCICKKTKWGSE